MKLEVRDLWSPDLVPPSEGLPADPHHFDVFAQVAIGEVGEAGHEVFSFFIRSPSALAAATPESHGRPTMLLDHFDWARVTRRVDEILLSCAECRDWASVMAVLSTFLRYDDAE